MKILNFTEISKYAHDVEYDEIFNKYINNNIFILKFTKLLKYMIRDLIIFLIRFTMQN